MASPFRQTAAKTLLLLALLCLISSCNSAAPKLAQRQNGLDDRTTHHSGETDFVTLSVTMPRYNLTVKPIIIQLALKNDRAGLIGLDHSALGQEADFRMQVWNFRHRWVPYTSFGEHRAASDPFERSFSITTNLKPGETVEWTYNLLDYFKLVDPGDYTLCIQRSIDATQHGRSYDRCSEELDVGPIPFSV